MLIVELDQMTAPQSEPRPKVWTRAEYQRLGELGAFAPDERVELVGGAIVARSPQNLAHARSIGRGNMLLARLFCDTHYVWVQLPLVLTDSSEPEPDLALVPRAMVDHPDVQDNPGWADLVIEVSDSSVRYDQTIKLALYASVGLPEYWIVNLVEKRLEVYRGPQGSDYRSCLHCLPGELVSPLFAPDSSLPVAGFF